MPSSSPARLNGQTLLLLLTPPLLWAGNFIAGRAISQDIPPVTLALLRWLIALACLLPFAWQPLRKDMAHYWPQRWRILGTALTGVAAFNLLVYWGLHSTSATNGIILNSFIPFLVALFGFVIYRQRLHLWQLLGLLISLSGVLIVVAHGSLHRLTALAFAPGDIIIFLAMICWALYTLWLREIPATIDRKGLMLIQVVLALLMLTPLCFWEQQTLQASFTEPRMVWALLYIGIFPSVIAFLAYSQAVVRVGSVRASLFIHTMPIFGSLLSSLLLNEAFHLYQLIGMLTIFAGIGFAQRHG
ncbi:MAG TPA: DMT family transporter [Methylophilus sp.]